MGETFVPDTALTPQERREAEAEAREGNPPASSSVPSMGERRVRERFSNAIDVVQSRADKAFERLGAKYERERSRIAETEADAAEERDRISPLDGPLTEVQRIEDRRRKADTATWNFDEFRRNNDRSETDTPREPKRWWWLAVVVVGLVETVMNGLLLHQASTAGFGVNWGIAVGVTALNLAFLGWIGSLICRWMLPPHRLRRILLGVAILPYLCVAAGLHFGLAHYRDAAQALEDSRTVARSDIDDIDARGAAEESASRGGLRPEQAAVGELQAQFLPWTAGALQVDPPPPPPPPPPPDETGERPPEPPPDPCPPDVDGHLPAGCVGYEARDGRLYLVEDRLAGSVDGWRSLLLVVIGFLALLLSVWEWYGRSEPLPHFESLHKRQEDAITALEAQEAAELAAINHRERNHLHILKKAETEVAALGVRLTKINEHRRQISTREMDLVQRVAEAGTSAVEGFRDANRQRRLPQDPPPAFWGNPWRPSLSQSRQETRGEWNRELALDLEKIKEAADRIRSENAVHAPDAADLFKRVRERLAQAAGHRPTIPRHQRARAHHDREERRDMEVAF